MVAFLIGHPPDEEWEQEYANDEKRDVGRLTDVGRARCHRAVWR